MATGAGAHTVSTPADPFDESLPDKPTGELRRGWTTGACATAAARGATELLLTNTAPAVAAITLPSGISVSFALTSCGWLEDQQTAEAGVIKDAGDDPDVTHGALVLARVRRAAPGTGITFRAGEGVGTVTKPGLPLPPGEPAINPVPRHMITQAVTAVASQHGMLPDFEVEIAIPGGEKLAERTLNARLGILGGLSILGTTGIVVPYSCAAWIHSIHRGIDVARATGIAHVAGSTGSTSEKAVQALYGLPEAALIDMGDFAGGMLKYLRQHPVPRVTIAGGFAKMVKLGQGMLDLHSKRGAVETEWLVTRLEELSAPPALLAVARSANTAQEVLDAARAGNVPLADAVAAHARATAVRALVPAGLEVDVVVFDRNGKLAGRAPQ
jgi:cobalt-precorrin-5B (C1)-methyltransferase